MASELFVPRALGNRYNSASAPTNLSMNTLLAISTTKPNFKRLAVVINSVGDCYCQFINNGTAPSHATDSTHADFVVKSTDDGRPIMLSRDLDLYITSVSGVNIVELG